MRKIVVAVMGTLSGLVMLFGYHTSTNSGSAAAVTNAAGTSSGTAGSSGSTSSSGSSSGSSSSGSSSSGSSSGSTSSSGSSSSGTFTGDAVQTRWGIVQVAVTVADGKITKAEAVQFPSENPRDQEINSYAVPQLNSEVVAAQSATIDTVSGATVTSDGYLQSLQSAIDQAKL